ncbi:histidine phosphatase family protein [Rhodococcus sp. NPDC058505]|uniref:histidine phosphatase family protein n=1 Tax=unclassified Rhodococcus (in: high G+C Gram-positive bacteria) TaxID=192944 RepID=UPI00364BA55B
MQGQLDTDLSERGRVQAKVAARALADRRPTEIISSDLRRALDTATALGEHAGLPVATDPRLRETHLGEWQGLTHSQVDERDPGARAAWRVDATWAPPGGESRIDVADRAVPVVEELLATRADWAERPVVLVAHGGLIAALTAALLDLPVERWPVLGGLGNTGWVQLSGHGEPDAVSWRLDVWNASAENAAVAGDVL